MLGFVLSGVLTELLGWRSVFLVAVPFVLVVLGVVPVCCPATSPSGGLHPTCPGRHC